MSKAFPPICTFAVLLFCTVFTYAQDMRASIEFDSSGSNATVRGEYLKPARNKLNLSFLRSIAGNEGLGNRISQLRLRATDGTDVGFRKLVDGEYLAEREFDSWEYRVDLSPLKNRNSTAHVSWLSKGTGILMLADVLPQPGKSGNSGTSARIEFVSPPGSDLESAFVHSSEPQVQGGFDVSDVENAVFYLGHGWEKGSSNSKGSVDVLVAGTWNFQPADAAQMAEEIYESYERILGRGSLGRPAIAISRFPTTEGFGHWEAETRGRNVTIISSDMPFRTQSLQRLHEQLRHEIFHLWIPNGVNLTGNYDWFYEGFALYQSLKLAVALNRIRFDDFLDTLSRAHTIDTAIASKTSMIQASNNRFAGSNTQVYARGMLVAFLTDLTLLQQSKGKLSVEDLIKDLYVKHRKPADRTDGNSAVLALLRSNQSLTPIVERYIVGIEKLEWTAELNAAGIEDTDAGPLTRLQVIPKATGRQKAMLDKLGYNNWRKMSPTSK